MNPLFSICRLITFLGMLVFCGAVVGQSPALTAQSNETRVNTTTTGDQWAYFWSVRTVAVQPDGSFIQVWIDRSGMDGQAEGIFAQRFNAGGTRVGGEFQVNTTGTGSQSAPAIAVAPDGSFIIVWDGPGTSSDVFAQRFSPTAARIGDEFLLSTTVGGNQNYPEIDFFPDGTFVAAFVDAGQTVLQRFDASARVIGQETRISSADGDVIMDSLNVRPDNSVLLTWGEAGDVYGQLFTSTLQSIGTAQRLNQYTTGVQEYSIARVDGQGSIVVVWESDGQDGSGMGVYGRRFDANFVALGNEFAITANTTGPQFEPQLAMSGGGNFVVAWSDNNDRDGGGGTGESIWMRLFDTAGNPVGSEILVNQTSAGYQAYPVADMNNSGRLVVSWAGNGTQAGQIDDQGIFSRRFQITQTGTTAIAVTPTSGIAGDLVTVTMSLTAPTNIANVSPNPLSVSGTNGVSATLVSGPTPASATVGTTPVTFTWTYRLTALNLAGQLTFGASADDNGATIFPYATSPSVTVTPSLFIRDLTAPNLIGDSNISSSPDAGPSVFTIGAKVTNPTTVPIDDVLIKLGDGVTPATFPATTMTLGQTSNTYQGSFRLVMLAGNGDASRPLFNLGPAKNVIAGGIDVSGNGSVGAEDDGVLSNGMTVIDGRVDVNKDGVVNTSDDRPLPPGVFDGYLEPAILDGQVDFNGDAAISVADVGTFGGETRNLYWQVAYQAIDAFGQPTWGNASDIGDDLRYYWTVWGTANQGGIARGSSCTDSVRVRNQISAASNKLQPSGAYISGGPPRVIDGSVDINSDGVITTADDGPYYAKMIIDGLVDMDGNGTISTADDGALNGFPVIDGSIDVDANGAITAEDSMVMAQPGQTFTITVHKASFGLIGAGYDGNRDNLFDYDFWHQPVGEAGWDASAFRLIDIQSDITGTGGGNPLGGITTHFSNEPYLARLFDGDLFSGGFNATYSYTFVVLSPGSSVLTPYQEAASGSNNIKYNGDYGYGVLVTTGTSGNTALSLGKTGGPNPTLVGGTTTWSMTCVNTGDTPSGDPGTGNGVVIEDAIPPDTTFVAGSATSSPYPSTIQHSTDWGATWTAAQPPAASVNRIRWHIEETLPGGASATVSFQTTINSGTPDFTLIPNIAEVRIGDGPVITTANAEVYVGGGPDHGDYSGFPIVTQRPDAAIRIGTLATDGEVANPANGSATGDDSSGDDEDLTMPAFYVNSATSLTIPVTVNAAALSGSTARVNVFVDWNGDGDVDDAGETQIAKSVIGSGSYTFNLTPPAGIIDGMKFLRIRLTEGAVAPAFSGASALKGEVEDYAITLLPPTHLSIGNLVFLDTNGNGHADVGEGVDGVTVQLYTSAQTPGVSAPLMTQTTTGGGLYLFEEIVAGNYRVHIPAAMFASGAPLYTTMSVPEGLSGDDDVGENGVNSATPAITGISSSIVAVALGQAPTDLNGETGINHDSDNAYDAAIDLTIDFGFANPLGVGNVMFNDANSNGRYDAGEGVAGVTVNLYRATDAVGVASPTASQQTDAAGHYFFDYLSAGSYFVHVPASEFVAGGQLNGLVSVTGSGSGNVDDSSDENGIDNFSPNVNGIRSNSFSLANNAAPTDATGENGYLATEDSRDDNNYDLTIDLGFRTPDPNSVGVGNSIFLDGNGNQQFDTGEGINGVTVKLFISGTDPASATPVAIATSVDGNYLFAGLAAGSYFIQIPPTMFASGAPLYRALSLPGQGGDNEIDDVQDENGDDPASPATSGVRSTAFTLAPNTEPTGLTSEFGKNATIDDIDDNNTDLTIDFGFYRPVGLGNLVYIDTSRNGLFNAGEGVDGVTVELYRDTQSPGFEPPLASAVTAGGGLYLFSNLVPGYYIVHIPTENFAPGGLLAAFTPLSGQGADDGADDDLDENGSDPTQAFAEGVSSLTITLASGTEPTDQTTEHGAGATSDNANDSDTDFTVDFAFYAASPVSFAQWQAQNPLGGQNGPADDPDGDGIGNAAEYGLGLSPTTGVLPWIPFEIKLNATSGRVDAFVRRLPTPGDMTVTLQGLNDLALSPAGWFDITTITPEIIGTVDGIETSEYRDVEQIPAFTDGKGFVRLQLVLDTNHDGNPEAVVNTDVWGWSRRMLQPQIITFSNPFSKSAVFMGAVTGVAGSTLDVAAAVGSNAIAGAMTGTIPWYIEVVSGDNEGHRFEVDELNSTTTTIVLETGNTLNTLTTIPPASLAGDRIALRPHWTLAEWLPPAKFVATNNSSTADRLMFYTGANFATTWLFANSGNPKWVNDTTLTDRGTRVMDPGEALLIQPRSTSAPNFVNLGVVRAHKFACPLKQGTRLIGGGWPMDQSAALRNLLYVNGCTGATSATRADRIQIWKGDATPGATTYDSHYLLKTTTLQQWVKMGDSSLANENNLPLFKALRGVYFNSYLGKPDYVAPRPWTP